MNAGEAITAHAQSQVELAFSCVQDLGPDLGPDPGPDLGPSL